MHKIDKSCIFILILFSLSTYFIILHEMNNEMKYKLQNLTFVEQQYYLKYNTYRFSFNISDGYYSALELTFLVMCYSYGFSELMLLFKMIDKNKNYLNNDEQYIKPKNKNGEIENEKTKTKK